MKSSFHVVNGTEYTRDCVGNMVPRVYIYLLSTDEKPIEGVHNAALAYEMDTKAVFIFDAENKKWLPM